ncbi:hypothetical protein [Candidatus Phytoplasma fraxini]|uniref:Sequence-variable mosaic (SVM) signal sequence domain-containing protein n=1 Tax=Ash yellows phytoplasma TaxID=35780 RepID=A0ABZ2U974_ASHYP
MTLWKKIYFIFLGFFSLFIIGVSLYYGLNNNNKITNNNNSFHNSENQQTLSFLEKRIKELEEENQQKIKEADEIQKQDALLDNQIRLKMDQLRDYLVQIGSLQKEIQTQEEELKKESLTPEEKTALEQKIKALKDQHTEIQTKKNQLNQEALALTKERQTLNQNKNETQKTISHQKMVLSQVTQFKALEEEINDLTEAINYNEAEKEQIKTLLIQNETNEEETQKLRNYQLFLDQQLFSFDQRIKKINQMIEVLKNPQLVQEKKKPKTFQNVYEMVREKAELLKLVHYFKADKHVLGYQKVKTYGRFIIWSPRNREKSFNRSFLWGNRNSFY